MTKYYSDKLPDEDYITIGDIEPKTPMPKTKPPGSNKKEIFSDLRQATDKEIKQTVSDAGGLANIEKGKVYLSSPHGPIRKEHGYCFSTCCFKMNTTTNEVEIHRNIISVDNFLNTTLVD